MSDDLVERLRVCKNLTGGPLSIALEAADRIETLEIALARLVNRPNQKSFEHAQRVLEGRA